MDFDQLALDLARRVADGEPVDWHAVEQRCHGTPLPLLRPLQNLETISRVHRASHRQPRLRSGAPRPRSRPLH